ncbi:RHS repeat domain-containing protein, partial [Aquimarina atlantica]|uniref:RHS repeat domain-containing protein n=1 Tax=Aquimarina atlantica TaxID=1317122 RepID=UPI000552627C
MDMYIKSNHRRTTKFGYIIGLLFVCICSVVNGQTQEVQQGESQIGGEASQEVGPPLPPGLESCRLGDYWPDRDKDGKGDVNASVIRITSCDQFITFDPPVIKAFIDLTGEIIGSGGLRVAYNNDDCHDDNQWLYEASTWYPDTDGDGHGDDSKPGIVSCAKVLGYAYKIDCNDNDPNITAKKRYYVDSDNDGFGIGTGELFCEKPAGYAEVGGDYNDDDPSIINLPTGEPYCQAQAETTVYIDKDGDGYGAGMGYSTCRVPDTGFSVWKGDCNDNDPDVNLMTWYRDKDGDGFGDPNDPLHSSDLSGGIAFPDHSGDSTPEKGCKPPPGYVDNNLDNCIGEKGPNNGCLVDENPNEKLNSIRQLSFNSNGDLISATKSYFDELGKPTQSQTYDIKNGKIWTAQTLYDNQGRSALQTLSAPVRNQALFEFKNNFIQNSGNATFTTADFENDPENPSTVNSQANTVGWYYSTNNTTEPYQDITERPYSRTIYSELNPGAILKTVGGNKIDGQWKNGYVFSMPAGQELSSTAAFGDAKYNNYKIVKTISRDVHGIDNVVFTDTDGNTLAAARSGNENGNTNSRTSTVVMGAQGYVDVHIPVGLQGVTVTQNQSLAPKQIEIYNLITEKKIATGLSNLPPGFYRIAVTNLNDFDAAAQNIKVAYPENYYDYSLNEYDKAGRLVSSYQPLHKLKSEYQYNALGQLEYTKSPDEGEAWFKYRRDGQIRFSQNSKQQAAGEFSYTNYDDRGRPIESGVLIHTGFTTSDPDANLPSGTKKEEHVTQYDSNDNNGLSTAFGSDTRKSNYAQQSFVAGNVAKTYTVNPETTTTWYSYDIYGRVQWIVQQINGLSGVKTIDYVYDPVTSQVTKVYYQKGMSGEQFVHRYTYDPADYSLTKVETSVDDTNFTEQATYEYYETGGLKRTNIAQGLQGIDYIYNLQGALKSINHPSLTNNDDPGGDSNDLFGMILDYHNEDYNRPVASIKSAPYGKDQYNGNIKGIRWNSDYNPIQGKHHAYSYQYDRNNWLKSAVYGTYGEGATTTGQEDIISTDVINSGATLDLTATRSITLKPGFHSKAGSTFSASIVEAEVAFNEDSNGDYKVDNITYDANGNILSLHRNKHTENGNNAMDQLSYKYYDDPNPANPNEFYKPNQLRRVEDAAGDVAGAEDIGDQNGDNYEYNSIGQLIKNSSENITYIYNASGLVTEVKKGNQPLVKFFYNDKGHRVRKESYNPSNGSLIFTEHYVRDAAGTAMAIYRNGQVIENTIYGTSRLGIRKSDGIHLYQLTDHLGNVRAVVGRNAQGQPMAMTSATDYYPFGMPMPNRKITNEPYRYAYQGQELDPET